VTGDKVNARGVLVILVEVLAGELYGGLRCLRTCFL